MLRAREGDTSVLVFCFGFVWGMNGMLIAVAFVHSLQISKAGVDCCDLIVRIRVIVDGASLSR